MHIDFEALDRCHLADLRTLEFDVLSVDVFDTAITRSLETPADVFALTEQRLGRPLGKAAGGFAWLRERAEEEARAAARATGLEEVSLADIYAHLWRLCPELRQHAAAIRRAELAAEGAVALAVPGIADLVARVRTDGRRVVFVSDMYLPREEIGRLLRACGYDLAGGLLVSAETGRTKAAGTQWAVLREMVGARSRILHVGDDPRSDVESPRAHGVAGWLFAAARSAARPGGPLAPPILPYSRMARVSRLAGLAVDAAGAGPGDVMRRFGASWGAAVAGSFNNWLEARVRQHRLDHLFFCARDGWLPSRVWKAAGSDARTGVAGSYLFVSRRAVCLAEAALDIGGGRLTSRSLERLSGGELAVRTLLSRSGLLECEDLAREAAREFGGVDAIVKSPEGTKRFRELLVRHQASVLHALQPFRAAAEGYLRQTMPSSGRAGIVDIGWNGTLQSAIVRLLGPREKRPTIFGFYYGLWPRAQAVRPQAGCMEGCFTNDFRPMKERPGLLGAVALLENLNLAPHGSTTGYRLEDDRWTPVLQDSPLEAAQHAAMIAPFQEAAAKAAGRLFAEDGSGARELDWKAGVAAIERLSLSPMPEERAVLGSILHAIDFEHSKFRRLIPDLTPGKDVPSPWDVDWPGGAALAWQETAKNIAGSEIWKNAVLASVRAFRDGLDPRTARMFA